MRKYYMAIVFVLLANTALAEILIVTKDGQGIWATSAGVAGSDVKYLDRATGAEKRIPKTQVAGLIPKMNRGEQVEPEKAKKYLDRIARLRLRYRAVHRQLNELEQGWKSLLDASPELEGKIDAFKAEYDASDKSPVVYKRATMNLSMIKYKDAQGKYGKRIDGLVEAIRSDFVSVNVERIKETAKAPCKTIDDFEDVCELVRAVLRAGKADDKVEIAALLETIRKLTYDAYCQAAYEVYVAKRSIDSYLESRRILLDVLERVADTAEQKEGVTVRVAGLTKQVASVHKGHNFDTEGYPLAAADMELGQAMARYSSRVTFTGIEMSEQCMIIAMEQVPNLRLGSGFSVPLKLIFNRAQPPDRKLALVARISGTESTYEVMFSLSSLKIKDGQAVVKFRDTYANLPQGFRAATDEYGRSAYYLYLACQRVDGSGSESWVALSKACGWALSR